MSVWKYYQKQNSNMLEEFLKASGFFSITNLSKSKQNTKKQLTWLPVSVTISSLATSALSLFRQTRWTLPPGGLQQEKHLIINY